MIFVQLMLCKLSRTEPSCKLYFLDFPLFRKCFGYNRRNYDLGTGAYCSQETNSSSLSQHTVSRGSNFKLSRFLSVCRRLFRVDYSKIRASPCGTAELAIWTTPLSLRLLRFPAGATEQYALITEQTNKHEMESLFAFPPSSSQLSKRLPVLQG